MSQPPDAFLIIVKGIFILDDVPLPGAALPLCREKVLLGRTSPDFLPTFPFSSPYVSRRHAAIEYKDEAYHLTDLPGNRHGTWINDKQLTPGVPHEIKDRDRISLANEEVVLIFATTASMGGETWDFAPREPPSVPPREPPSVPPTLVLNHDRREVILNGKVLVRSLGGRLYDLLELQYDNRGSAVSNLQIKQKVYSDRGLGVDGIPMVDDQEVTTLVYRLRERLKPHGDLIRIVPRYGYMLDLSC